MNLFFTQSVDGSTICLDAEESRHCIKVLRLGKHDVIHVTDGKGRLYEAAITDCNGGLVRASVIGITKSEPETTCRLHLAIAPTKNADRFEWFLEKSVEIGIQEISPMFCARSERNRINSDRLQKILISAVKQSLKTRLPVLNQGISFSELISSDSGGMKFIASCTAAEDMEIQKLYNKGEDVLVLIGPEGDFTQAELDAAVIKGFKPVSLGPGRLRTETAGIYVTAVINLINRM